MNALTIAPVQWSRLKDIDDVKPLNDDDTDCLVEIRDVLRKHGKMDRFGVALLHSHFELTNEEIMVELTDDESRTLVTKPVKQANAGDSNVGTIWMLQEGDVATMSWCRKFCRKWALGGHRSAHNNVPSK